MNQTTKNNKIKQTLKETKYRRSTLDCRVFELKVDSSHLSKTTKDKLQRLFLDENIKGWQSGWFGKRVSESALGGIIRDLKHKSHTPIVVDRYFPSTQLCPRCGIVIIH